MVFVALCATLLFGGFAIIFGWPAFVLFGFYHSGVAWWIAMNKTWHVRVAGGEVTWDRPLAFFRRQSVLVSEIDVVEINLDDKYEIALRLKGGRRRFPFIQPPLDPEAFVAALVDECPSIFVERKHRGTT
jgi:hypothetical protein